MWSRHRVRPRQVSRPRHPHHATLGPAPVPREELATWPSDQLTFGLAAKFVAGARVTLRQVLELELIQMS